MNELTTNNFPVNEEAEVYVIVYIEFSSDGCIRETKTDGYMNRERF